MALALMVLFYLLSPAVVIYLCRRWAFLGKIGPVMVAYLLGLLVGNIGILPEGAKPVQDTLNSVFVPLALPLLLFSMNLREWMAIAGKAMVSALAGIVALVGIIVLGHSLFQSQIVDAWKVGGMLAGVYTGGTPNMAALQVALEVDSETYLLTHTFDTIFSLAYILLIISYGKKIVGSFLPAFSLSATNEKLLAESNTADNESYDDYSGILPAFRKFDLWLALGVSVLILGIGGGLSLLVPKENSTTVAILAITTLGIAASFVKTLHKIKQTFELGMYFILIFCLVVASMASFDQIANVQPALVGFVAMALFGTLAIHLLFSKLLKVDVDTTLVTSTALICSPPFVPVVASALQNKHVLLSGITVGILGYALGNYLGIAMAYLLKQL